MSGTTISFFNDKRKRKAGFALALATACLAAVVVMLGAYTRLVDAGLGCPDWPGCYGHLLWPDEAHEVARAEQLFPESPVEADKTWPEMVHRYFAGTLGLLIAALAFLSWRRREEIGYPFRLPVLLLFLVVWQAMFGMWTVTLKLWPQVVTLHLLGGVSIFSLTWLLALRLDDTRWRLNADQLPRLHRLKPWIVAGILLVAIQILLGGWTSSNYAAFACPDFPTCHKQWLPDMDPGEGFNVFQTIGPNYLGGLLENDARVAIHFAHRVGALVLTSYLILLAAMALRVADRRLNRMIVILLAVVALQVSLGIGNVIFRIPLPMAVAHNAVGALLLVTLVTLGARVWMAKPREAEVQI